jgi:CcmD family protein
MNYLMSAYIAIWFILFVYLFSLASRQNKLKKEVDQLMKQLRGDR